MQILMLLKIIMTHSEQWCSLKILSESRPLQIKLPFYYLLWGVMLQLRKYVISCQSTPILRDSKVIRVVRPVYVFFPDLLAEPSWVVHSWTRWVHRFCIKAGAPRAVTPPTIPIAAEEHNQWSTFKTWLKVGDTQPPTFKVWVSHRTLD